MTNDLISRKALLDAIKKDSFTAENIVSAIYEAPNNQIAFDYKEYKKAVEKNYLTSLVLKLRTWQRRVSMTLLEDLED